MWERAILTQMHFAELSIKTRQIGLTVVGAALALAAALHYKADGNLTLAFFGYFIPITSLLVFGAAAFLYAISILDVGVYHRMLRGAVKFNEKLEEKIKKEFGVTPGLTQLITNFSRYDQETQTENKRPAGNRIQWFYRIMILLLVVLGFLLIVAFLPPEVLGQ